MSIHVAVRRPETLSAEQQLCLKQAEVEAHYQALRTDPAVQTRRTQAADYILSRLPGGEDPAARKKQRIRLLQELGIPTATWRRFATGSTVPTEGLISRFSAALGLSPEEEEALRNLAVKDLFPVNAPLEADVLEHLRAWVETDLRELLLSALKAAPEHPAQWAASFRETVQMLDRHDLPTPVRRHLHTLEKKTEDFPLNRAMGLWFQAHAGLSPTAMEAFSARSGAVTSQSTLLKLVVAFGLSEREAKTFLRLVGSDFTLRRDLVVLACLRCGLTRMDELYQFLALYAPEITEAYEKPYQNLYTEDQIEIFCTVNYGILPE